MEKQIYLMDVVKLCIARWWVLLIGFIVGAMLSGLYTGLFVTPMYVSAGTLYSENTSGGASQSSSDVNLNSIVARQTLVKTYAEILSSNVFLQQVAEETGLDYSYMDILRMLSMTSKNETEILVISVTTANPRHAYIIAKTIMDMASDQVGSIVKGGSMTPIDEPEIPLAPSSPNLIKNILLGAIIGFLVSFLIAFLSDFLDDKVKGAEQLSDAFKYPVLGEIPLYIFENDAEDDLEKQIKQGSKA